MPMDEMQRANPLAPRNLGMEPVMGGNTTEILLSPDEQSSEVQESNRSESTEASFNTTASEGGPKESTLRHAI